MDTGKALSHKVKVVIYIIIMFQIGINMFFVYKLGVMSEKIGQLEDMVFNGGYVNRGK